jgi:competence protein ComEC
MSAGLKLVACGSLCVSAGWYFGGINSHQTRLTFLAVGQGDCAVLQHEGRTILIDTGPTEGEAKRVILPKLRRLGVVDVDLVLLTHPDKDHVAGVPAIAHTYPTAKFAISAEFRDHSDWRQMVSDWRLPSSRIEYLPRRMSGRLGDVRLDIFCPEIWSSKQDNDGSAFLKVACGTATAVLSGDATAEAEATAAVSADWSAQVMKAGHHGSRTSTSFTWLREVHPQTVIFSCGKDNQYGHPHAEVVKRVEDAGALVRRTYEGDVRFVVSGGKFVFDK